MGELKPCPHENGFTFENVDDETVLFCPHCKATATITRPQPSAEPVAVWWRNMLAVWHSSQNANRQQADGSAIRVLEAYGDERAEAARREALEQAAKVADQMAITQRALGQPEDWPEDAWNARQLGIIDKLERAAERIRALKENTNG